jgi:lysophospholipase L1-like esterase
MSGAGVLAFGDSITNGGGELQWGVALQSWALWTARALGLPFTNYAVDGARAQHVVEEQIPAFSARNADPDARYELGCLYIGVNDARALDWDRDGYEQHLRTALAFMVGRCQRALVLTAPLGLGRPRNEPRVAEMNSTIERAAAEQGALVVDLKDFGARNRVMVDHIHPTAFGQVAIAERALEVLARDLLPPKVLPSQLIDYATNRRGRLKGDATYVYRHAKLTARELMFRARLAPRRP